MAFYIRKSCYIFHAVSELQRESDYVNTVNSIKSLKKIELRIKQNKNISHV